MRSSIKSSIFWVQRYEKHNDGQTDRQTDRQIDRIRESIRRHLYGYTYRELIGFQQSAVFSAIFRIGGPQNEVCWTTIRCDPLSVAEHPYDDVRDAVLWLKQPNILLHTVNERKEITTNIFNV